jgi:ABC-2 type transport system permease protein
MKKIVYIIRRIVKQTVNDRRSLGLILIVPLFLFTMIYFLLGDSDYKADIAQCGISSQLVEKIKVQEVTVRDYDLDAGKEAVKDKKVDALLYKEGTGFLMYH